ncbi:hypothetical protein GGP55_003143 [Salinibacter ruber]|uniref:hypothetical protein n=1 Tax=Salinibacter ruber TaxID=146919 RepID=UPI0021698361|nr:hypothetical protein [Salinibacter ruber]MCS3632525.1 hypothetical protein [Salinibacter ruber]
MTTIKRSALLLFAGLFGLATLQTATAQDSDNHDVTIKVDKINDIAVSGAPTIEVGQKIDEWRPDDDVATYDVETNVNDTRMITVSASQTGSSDPDNAANYGLRLDTENSQAPGDGSFPGEGASFVLTDVGESDFNGGTLVRGFQQVGAFGLSLDYEAKVNYEFNPGDDAEVKVTYTLTSSGSSGGGGGSGGGSGSN